MRKNILYVTTLFYKLWFAHTKCIRLKGGRFFRVKIKGYKTSKIAIENEMSNTNIDIIGNNNTIISQGIVLHSQIKIIGNNNKVIFKKDCKFCNSKLLIRANNAEFIIGERSNILEGYFICQGKSNYIHIVT